MTPRSITFTTTDSPVCRTVSCTCAIDESHVQKGRGKHDSEGKNTKPTPNHGEQVDGHPSKRACAPNIPHSPQHGAITFSVIVDQTGRWLTEASQDNGCVLCCCVTDCLRHSFAVRRSCAIENIRKCEGVKRATLT